MALQQRKCSRRAAHDAVDLFFELHDRQLAGKVVDKEFVTMLAGVDAVEDVVVGDAGSILAMAIKHPAFPRLVIGSLGVVATCIVAVVASWMVSGSPRHTVAGTVMLDQRPLPYAEIVFLPKQGDLDAVTVTASEKGAFRVRSLPTGEYAIVLASAAGLAKIPPRYGLAETTPFRLVLTRSRYDLRMLAHRDKDG